MMDQDRILEKIRKCLALSKSANEHEAAAALRQAQALMREHGINGVDIVASAAGESRTKAGASRTPSSWESRLAWGIDEAFGTRHIFVQGTGEWMFVGVGASAEVAGYSMAVMSRQVRNARKQYIDAKLSRCGRTNKTRRADLYCDAWVYSAISKVMRLDLGEEETAAIEAYIGKRYATDTLKPRNRTGKLKTRDLVDLEAGGRDGKGAYLHQGVGATGGPALLE